MRIVFVGIVTMVLLASGVIFWVTKKSAFPEKTISKPRGKVALGILKERGKSENNMSELVRLKTKDGVDIVGDYYSASGRSAVVLLHMMPADRKSWVSFAEKLQGAGFQALAIDLRGHGESQGGPAGYKNFSDEEHQASRLDVEAAAEFLKNKGVSKLNLVGASIGANLALDYLKSHPDARSAILLSLGLDYRGLKTAEAISGLLPAQGVYLVASEEDTYSLDSANQLIQKISLDDRHILKIFQNSGHGTAILEKNPEFGNKLVEWFKQF